MISLSKIINQVTFADTNSLDLPIMSSSHETASSIETIPRVDSSGNDDVLTPEEPSNSLSTSDLPQSVARKVNIFFDEHFRHCLPSCIKSILQKPDFVNGSNDDEKVYHGLAIRFATTSGLMKASFSH